MDQVTSHHIWSTCGITATTYNVTFNEGEVTPCDTVSVTVTPVNGLPNSLINGTSRILNPVYLFEGTVQVHHSKLALLYITTIV